MGKLVINYHHLLNHSLTDIWATGAHTETFNDLVDNPHLVSCHWPVCDMTEGICRNL